MLPWRPTLVEGRQEVNIGGGTRSVQHNPDAGLSHPPGSWKAGGLAELTQDREAVLALPDVHQSPEGHVALCEPVLFSQRNSPKAASCPAGRQGDEHLIPVEGLTQGLGEILRCDPGVRRFCLPWFSV